MAEPRPKRRARADLPPARPMTRLRRSAVAARAHESARRRRRSPPDSPAPGRHRPADPPALASASPTRAPAGSSTKPGFCTPPLTKTKSGPGVAVGSGVGVGAAVGGGCSTIGGGDGRRRNHIRPPARIAHSRNPSRNPRPVYRKAVAAEAPVSAGGVSFLSRASSWSGAQPSAHIRLFLVEVFWRRCLPLQRQCRKSSVYQGLCAGCWPQITGH